MNCFHVFIILVVLRNASAQSGSGQSVGTDKNVYTTRDIIRAIEQEVEREHLGSGGSGSAVGADDIDDSSAPDPSYLTADNRYDSPQTSITSRVSDGSRDSIPDQPRATPSSTANDEDDNSSTTIPPRVNNGGDYDYSNDDDQTEPPSDEPSENGNEGSRIELAHFDKVADVMKKLKKSKTDEEMADKLRKGTESPGVSFKIFEQLSDLWISILRRIWRVWKAKGAKQVMHSIVNDMVTKTTQTVAPKIGSFVHSGLKSVSDNGVKMLNASYVASNSNNQTSNNVTNDKSHQNNELIKVQVQPLKQSQITKSAILTTTSPVQEFNKHSKKADKITSIQSSEVKKVEENIRNNATIKQQKPLLSRVKVTVNPVSKASKGTTPAKSVKTSIKSLHTKEVLASSKTTQPNITVPSISKVNPVSKASKGTTPAKSFKTSIKYLHTKEVSPSSKTTQANITVPSISKGPKKPITAKVSFMPPKNVTSKGNADTTGQQVITEQQTNRGKQEDTNKMKQKFKISDVQNQKIIKARKIKKNPSLKDNLKAHNDELHKNGKHSDKSTIENKQAASEAKKLSQGDSIKKGLVASTDSGSHEDRPHRVDPLEGPLYINHAEVYEQRMNEVQDEVMRLENELTVMQTAVAGVIKRLADLEKATKDVTNVTQTTVILGAHQRILLPGNSSNTVPDTKESPTVVTETLPGNNEIPPNITEPVKVNREPPIDITETLPETIESTPNSAPPLPETMESTPNPAPPLPETMESTPNPAPPLPETIESTSNAAPPLPETIESTSNSAPALPENMEPATNTAPPLPETEESMINMAGSIPDNENTPTTDELPNNITKKFQETTAMLQQPSLPVTEPFPVPASFSSTDLFGLSNPFTSPIFIRYPPQTNPPQKRPENSPHQVIIPLASINGLQTQDEPTDSPLDGDDVNTPNAIQQSLDNGMPSAVYTNNKNNIDEPNRVQLQADVKKLQNVLPEKPPEDINDAEKDNHTPTIPDVVNKSDSGDVSLTKPKKPSTNKYHIQVPNRPVSIVQRKVAMEAPQGDQQSDEGRPIINIIVPNSETARLFRKEMCQSPCKNGGKCVGVNTCKCPALFLGNHCERFSLLEMLNKKAKPMAYKSIPRPMQTMAMQTRPRPKHYLPRPMQTMAMQPGPRPRHYLPRRMQTMAMQPRPRPRHYLPRRRRLTITDLLRLGAATAGYRLQNEREPITYEDQQFPAGGIQDNRRKSFIPRRIVTRTNPVTKRKQFILEM